MCPSQLEGRRGTIFQDSSFFPFDKLLTEDCRIANFVELGTSPRVVLGDVIRLTAIFLHARVILVGFKPVGGGIPSVEPPEFAGQNAPLRRPDGYVCPRGGVLQTCRGFLRAPGAPQALTKCLGVDPATGLGFKW